MVVVVDITGIEVDTDVRMVHGFHRLQCDVTVVCHIWVGFQADLDACRGSILTDGAKSIVDDVTICIPGMNADKNNVHFHLRGNVQGRLEV